MLANTGAAARASQTIIETIHTVMDERGLDTSQLDESAKLVDTLGLKSMDIAEIVLHLEDDLEVDPFREIPITSVRTVGDLINAYQVTLDPAAPAHPNKSESAGPVLKGVSRRAGRRR